MEDTWVGEAADAAEVGVAAADQEVVNHAGGAVFAVDDFTRLRRFLILGSDAANYYVDVAKLAVENAVAVSRLLASGQGPRVVQEVVAISQAGRAPKQGPGIFVLAMAARLGDVDTRRAALAALPLVARTASTLFEFVQRCKELGAAAKPAPAAPADGADSDAGAKPAAGKVSWGRAMRRAVAAWYLDKAPLDLAYQLTKYSQRSGWSHADLLRLAHPDPLEHAAKRARKEAGAAAGGTAATASAEQAGPAEQAQEVKEKAVGQAEGEAAAAAEVQVVLDAAAAQRVADQKALFAFIVAGGKVVDPDASLAAALARFPPGSPAAERAAAREARKRKRSGASDAAASPATAPDAHADAAVAAAREPQAAAAAAAPAVSSVVEYLAAAERLRKGLRYPAVPKTEEQRAAAKAARQARAAAARKGGRRRGGMHHLVDSDDEDASQQAQAQAAAEVMVPPEVVAARAAVEEEACTLIRKHRFAHEHVGDTALLRSTAVWSALLDVGMPMTALVRNLGRLSALGMLGGEAAGGQAVGAVPSGKDYAAVVAGQLRSAKAVAGARLHPIVLLEAARQYASGRGDKGSLRWQPVAAVQEALEDAFYLAFKNAPATGKRWLVGLDVSGSMGCAQCVGMRSLNAREASAAMLMALMRAEPAVTVTAFTSTLQPLDRVTKDMKLDEVIRTISNLPFGSTDCAQPMLYALERRIPVDVFVVMTDNETWAGHVKPVEALRRYRKEMGIPARLAVLAFSATGFSIADPKDAGMLDVGGLDSGVPQILADFATGKV